MLIPLALVLSAGGLAAASLGENRAYNAAAKAFTDKIWDRAETQFAQFILNYPKSTRAPEVVLLQAEAQFQQQEFTQAIALLTGRQAGAGKLADGYLYWIGEAEFQSTNYPAAAAAFARVVQNYPASTNRLQASVGEAAARAKLGEWTRVVELLETPDGVFQKAVWAVGTNELAARGYLLLSEAQLKQKNYPAAEAALQLAAKQPLEPEADWQRQYLLCRVQAGAERTKEALQSSTSLLSLADATRRRDFFAESVAFRADLFEKLEQRDEAIAVLSTNLNPGVSVEWQRKALLKVAELAQAQDQVADASRTLEQFVGQSTNSAVSDLALLTLGELRLKQHMALAGTNQTADVTNGVPAGTNYLQQAVALFDRLINTYSNSTLVGKAELDKGWCLWLDGKLPESTNAFTAAVAQLPPSEDRVVARCKLADALFRQEDYAGALQNYRAVMDEFAEWPELKSQLGDQVLYQSERAYLERKEMAGATNAVEQILALYPASPLAGRSLLLLGQGYADLDDVGSAREWLGRLGQASPESPLLPEAKLAIARTYAQKSDWPNARTNYDAWLERFPTNDLRPRAEFDRAWANWQSGQETNALNQFTNLVAQFANNELAPMAQWWVADSFYRAGDFVNAEKNYKNIFQNTNWQSSPLVYPARMMAGRAAVGRRGYEEALGYFTNLTSDLNCPTNVWLEAMFAYGGTLMLRNASETTNNPADLISAIRVFGKIHETYTNTESAAMAWGEKGNCYLQLAVQDAGSYELASNAYQQVVSAPYASVAARSQAKVGLAIVAEKQARRKNGEERDELLKQARDYYLDVFYDNDLRGDEKPDLFWKEKAGLEAARLMTESLEAWSQAVSLYRDLQQLLPQKQVAFEKKIAAAQENLDRGKK